MSLAQRRREVRAVPPDAWAAWVLNRAFTSQMQPRDEITGHALVQRLETVLLPLQGWAATLSVWLEEILPARLAGVRPEHLDTLLGQGQWLWLVHGEGEATVGTEPLIAFHHSAFPANATEKSAANEALDDASRDLLKCLAEFGPATSHEMAKRLSVPLDHVRQSLFKLISARAVTNEKVAFINRFYHAERSIKGTKQVSTELSATRPSAGRRLNNFRALLSQQGVGGGGRGPGRAAVGAEPGTEGRWRLTEALSEVDENAAARDERQAAWSALLMERYGVICREVVKFGCPNLNWPELADWLEAAEWRGEVRRGYFVEGLSGVQYTTDDIAAELALFCDRSGGGDTASHADELHLISVLDPANLYGASAPLDLPLLAGGRARLPRISGNAILMAHGRPIWIIQESGKRLTSLPHASKEVLRLGLRHLIRYFTKSSNKWTITTLDETPPVKSTWADELAEMGFVRDALSMTLYRGLT